MSIVVFPGGQAELRSKPTVGGRELLQAEGFTAINLIQQKMPGIELNTIADLSDIPTMYIDSEVIKAFNNLNRAGIVAFVKSWTLGLPPTMDSLSDLETDQYDALLEAVAPLIVSGMFGQDFSVDGALDPNSPTVPSSESNDGLRAAQVQSMNQTSTQPDSGESISSDEPSIAPTTNTLTIQTI